jgi:hypothetical protein
MALGIALLVHGNASAQDTSSPAAVLAMFEDGAALTNSVSEILSLNLRVADALARALADCGPLAFSGEVATRDQCERSRRYFKIVAPNGALRRLFGVFSLMQDQHRTAPGGVANADKNFARATRLSIIENDWSNAIAHRLEQLDGERR